MHPTSEQAQGRIGQLHDSVLSTMKILRNEGPAAGFHQLTIYNLVTA